MMSYRQNESPYDKTPQNKPCQIECALLAVGNTPLKGANVCTAVLSCVGAGAGGGGGVGNQSFYSQYTTCTAMLLSTNKKGSNKKKPAT